MKNCSVDMTEAMSVNLINSFVQRGLHVPHFVDVLYDVVGGGNG